MLKKSKKNSRNLTSRIKSKPTSRIKLKKTTKTKKINKTNIPKKLSIKVKLLITLLVIGGLFLSYILLSLPKINAEQAIYRNPMITILAANNEEIAVFGDKYSEPVKINKIPPILIQGLLHTEDKRFYNHFGFDAIAIIRAFWNNLVAGEKISGASTITQQLAKNLFLTSEKSYIRKIKEFFLAIYLEYKFSKEQILSLYLNRAYFGSGNYGVGAAAKYYYGKKTEDLNSYEAISLVALLKSPLGYNPILNAENSKKRTISILEKMQKDGLISRNSWQITPAQQKIRGFAGYFNDWILAQSTDILGEINQDIIIHTTLNKKLQKISENQAKNITNELQVAIIASDYNGAIKAMVGGKNYQKSQFNRATQAQRQQGSLLKPFAYLLAVQKGYSLSSQIYDSPVKFGEWEPQNFSKKHYGWVTLEEALVQSLNTVVAQIVNEIGIDEFQKFLARFGINAYCSDSPVIALGVCNNTLLDMTSAYTSLASGGYAIYPYGITKITNNQQKILYQKQNRDKNAIIDAHSLSEIENALVSVVLRGTGKKAYYNKNIKGKTGTTQNYRDALFIGYDDKTVLGVWIGKDDNSPMEKITGGNLPAIIFKNIMIENLDPF